MPKWDHTRRLLSESQPRQLYGLVKLPRHVARQLRQYVRQTSSYGKNSEYALEIVQQYNISNSGILVSFNVESLVSSPITTDRTTRRSFRNNANTFIEAFEQKAIESSTLKPKYWCRYMNDTVVIWPHGPDKYNTCMFMAYVATLDHPQASSRSHSDKSEIFQTTTPGS